MQQIIFNSRRSLMFSFLIASALGILFDDTGIKACSQDDFSRYAFSAEDCDEGWVPDQIFEKQHENWLEEKGYMDFERACSEDKSIDQIIIAKDHLESMQDLYKKRAR